MTESYSVQADSRLADRKTAKSRRQTAHSSQLTARSLQLTALPLSPSLSAASPKAPDGGSDGAYLWPFRCRVVDNLQVVPGGCWQLTLGHTSSSHTPSLSVPSVSPSMARSDFPLSLVRGLDRPYASRASPLPAHAFHGQASPGLVCGVQPGARFARGYRWS